MWAGNHLTLGCANVTIGPMAAALVQMGLYSGHIPRNRIVISCPQPVVTGNPLVRDYNIVAQYTEWIWLKLTRVPLYWGLSDSGLICFAYYNSQTSHHADEHYTNINPCRRASVLCKTDLHCKNLTNNHQSVLQTRLTLQVYSQYQLSRIYTP